MAPQKKISLVIPAYNEEESIHGFVERVMPIMLVTGYDFEMVFVDDGSSDRTSFILSAPVSYTHLDVDKRQANVRGFHEFGELIADSALRATTHAQGIDR